MWTVIVCHSLQWLGYLRLPCFKQVQLAFAGRLWVQLAFGLAARIAPHRMSENPDMRGRYDQIFQLSDHAAQPGQAVS